MMNDFRRQWQATGAAVLQATERVGASGWFVLGPEVAEFERLLAEGCGCAHAIGCGSGLDAIELSLRALGLVEGDRVLTTPLSAFATTLAIVRAGGTPVFVDVDENGLLDLGKVEQVLSADPTIRYLVPVHLYGQPLNLEDLEALKRRFGIFIVEDCAQAIGATWEGRPVGGVGDLSTLSFYPTKNLGALGDGGAILTNDRNLMLKCQSLRDYGQTGKYEHTLLGLNSRLDELHAAILRTAFLPRLSDWSTRRRDIASQYLSEIAHPQVKIEPCRVENSRYPFIHTSKGRK
jgi:dTDP-4-amino-4,6-dideoxygalactose transaminase